MMTHEEILDTIDKLFDDNKPKEAEQFMLSQLATAKEAEDVGTQLLLLNELIGYYRQTSEVEPLTDVVVQSVELAEKMGLAGTIPYATTLVNAGNACRSMGKFEQALEYYDTAKEIYETSLSEDGMEGNELVLAGFYNNFSLLCQEMSDYIQAKKYQLKSLKIVTDCNAGFEIAVSHANLANTCLVAGEYDESIMYAQKAIELFKARELRDPHYCAALSALGNCYLLKGKVLEAKDLFGEASTIVEETFGKNFQYDRLMDSLKQCDALIQAMNEDVMSEEETDKSATAEVSKKEQRMSGMELAKAYYETYGKQMIRKKFPAYENKIAVGLVGEGSECFGFDDGLSTDHDFGPEFCLWVTQDTYDAIGEDLQKAYEELPDEFMGFKRSSTVMGAGRRGVCTIDDFYTKHLGTTNVDEINYAVVPDYRLAVCTNGQIFRDDEGTFSALREKLLQGYPQRIRLLKLADDVAGFSQCGQYNMMRMLERGDFVTGEMMLADCCKHAMKLYHHFLNVYPPHDKWLAKSLSLLPGGEELLGLLEKIVSCSFDSQVGDVKTRYQLLCTDIETIADIFASYLYQNCDISDIDNYLDHHVAELLFKAGIIDLSKEELVDRVVRLEFQAFDEVQNEGGRAYCQNNWPTFNIMRKSQYLTWNHEMLVQYLYDFTREYESGHNLITEKYGRMMESTSPERFEEIKENFPELSDEKRMVIEEIVKVQMKMADAFAEQYPKVAGNARNLHTYEDEIWDTSYETYLRGEISTYSDKMLQLYGRFVVSIASAGENLALMTIENTAKLYGYKTIEELED